MKTTKLHITGMTCAACSSRIEKVLGRQEGVHQVSVNLATAKASLEFDPKFINLQSIKHKIEQLGYGAKDEQLHPKSIFEDEVRSYFLRFSFAFLLSIPLFWAMLAHVPGMPDIWTPALFHSSVFQWLLATILQFYIGFPFYYGAFQALKQRTANMDVLIALSTTAAYFYSHYLVFRPDYEGMHHLYFDTIGMIMTAVLLGKWLESIAKGRAMKDLNALYSLQAQMVRVIRRQTEEWIPAEQLRSGDHVVIHAAEWISADGMVIAGEAEVDESMLTGESRTVLKKIGDPVYSGTRSVIGSIRIEAAAGISGTRLARMIGMIEQAQSEKPMIARKVDRVAAYFVPMMIVCAFVSFIGWSYVADTGTAIRNAMAVLLVACPCALGLATPVSILVASGLAAKNGILIKEGHVLENLYRVNTILLDKTGTLTEGKPEVKSIYSIIGNDNYLLRLAAAIEQHSAHPLALAIVQAARKRRLILPEALEIREYAGKGLSGKVEGKCIQIGKRTWLEEVGVRVNCDEGCSSAFDGMTQIYIAIDGRWIGLLTLADQLKYGASSAVTLLKRQGDVWMVTGDHPLAAQSAASDVGIQTIKAGMLPEQKLEWVRKLQREGRKVAMIGDGVNDAAALAAADIGIAMGGGTDSAMQAGDVILVKSRLSGVVEAISLSRQTMQNIRQNLLFALLYNVWTVPLAAMGYLDPRIACILMALSSVMVVCNALRLQRVKLRGESVGSNG